MDIFDLLNKRKVELFKKSADIRKNVSKIIDDDSFVELNAFSFGKNEFYNEDETGLGVVTGFATIDGYPVYVVAQNGQVLNGGLSKANLDKICNCLKKAIETQTAVLYLLDTKGVQVGEGVAVLEGIAKVLALSNQLKEVAPQFALALGDVFGSFALFAANCDYVYCVNNSCISYASPAVAIASANMSITKDVLGGKDSKNGVNTFAVKAIEEVKDSIVKIFNVLPNYSGLNCECNDELNRSQLKLNTTKNAKLLIDAIYDKNTFVELNAKFADDVITGVGRIGGISTAVVLFNGEEKGVELDLNNVLKIKNFANYCYDNGFPLLTLINTVGIKQDALTATSPILAEISNMLYNLTALTRLSVVYGKAIGFGYTAFASREFGNSYTFAFADAKISLFDKTLGASTTFGTIDQDKLSELEQKYEDMQDAFNSAKLGCIDNIIEPQFVRQHIIMALQSII
ncbi:MAG: hypothetical protein IKV61_05700 [Clostridia bacterium]|nr:hypothetical protein [Clostridia bacterium]